MLVRLSPGLIRWAITSTVLGVGRVVQNRGTTRVPAQGRLFWVPTWAVFARVLEYPDTGSGDVSVILNIPASSFTSPLFGVEFRVDPSPTLIDVYCLI